MKRPSLQFYPGDWLRSTDLRSCSVGARGLWIEMICLMHEGNPYGHLKVGGKVILPPNLARIVGATLAEVEGWLAELTDAGVCSVAEDGCYLSRRMIRDEKVRESRASGGKLGGNPALTGRAKVGGKVNLPTNLPPTPATAIASSSAIGSGADAPSPPPNLPPDWLPAREWEAFRKFRKKIKHPLTAEAEALAVQELDKLRAAGNDPAAVLNQSILRGWRGLFAIKQEHSQKGQQHGKHSGFAEQDYRAGTDGFVVT